MIDFIHEGKLVSLSYPERLEIYSYYKQGTADHGKMRVPAITDIGLRAKWFAWKKVLYLTKEEAMIMFHVKFRKHIWTSGLTNDNRMAPLYGSDITIEMYNNTSSLQQPIYNSTYLSLLWFFCLSYLPFPVISSTRTDIPLTQYPLLTTNRGTILSGSSSIFRYLVQTCIIPLHLFPHNNPKKQSSIFNYIDWHILNLRNTIYAYNTMKLSNEELKQPKEKLLEELGKLQDDYLKENCFIGKEEVGPSIADLVCFADLYNLVVIGKFVFSNQFAVLDQYVTKMKSICVFYTQSAKY